MLTVKLSAFSQAGIPFSRGLRLRRYQWLQALDWLWLSLRPVLRLFQ